MMDARKRARNGARPGRRHVSSRCSSAKCSSASNPLRRPPRWQQRERRGGGEWRGRGNNGGNNDAGQSNSGYQRGWQGPPGTENSRDAQRYNRRAQENAIRYGTSATSAAMRSRTSARTGATTARTGARTAATIAATGGRTGAPTAATGTAAGATTIATIGRTSAIATATLFRLRALLFARIAAIATSRFSVGLFLDRLFFDQRYWLTDPSHYRLPSAPDGTQWVRYYNDVLLVDVYTGEVLDVIYDFFW